MAKGTKLALGASFEVSKVEERITETEEGQARSWKYTLEDKGAELKVIITTKSEIPELPVETKSLSVLVTSAQSKLDV